MQVKKFEAPTIQEALDHIKRELGPEAIILQTKKNKRGFGLMSKSSVEVTAAVSERSIQKKQTAEKRLPEETRKAVQRMPAYKQAELYGGMAGESAREEAIDSHLSRAASQTRDQVEVRRQQAPAQQQRAVAQPARAIAKPVAAAATAPAFRSAPVIPTAHVFSKPITQRRYVDIEDEESLAGQLADKTAGAPVGNLSIEQEVEHLKRMLQELHRAQEKDGGSGSHALVGGAINLGTELTPALQDAFDQMVVGGIDKRYALSLVKKVKFEIGEGGSTDPDRVIDQLAGEIMQSIEVISPLSGLEAGRGQPTVIALVGPTGVGKTTTVAKIASQAIRGKNLRVGLINLDSYKVAAFDQLATYAKILNVPFRSASSTEDLQAAMADFQDLDLVLIDTAGRSQRDQSALKETETLISAIPNVQTHLVLSSTTRDTELYDMASRFKVFHPQGLILSKLDEATIHGGIYNVSQRAKLPLIYFTTGQRVPEDIEEATSERLVALLMNL